VMFCAPNAKILTEVSENPFTLRKIWFVVMSGSHLVRKPCDCLPNSGSEKPRAVLLRDDTDVSATGHVLVLISPLRVSASQTAILVLVNTKSFFFISHNRCECLVVSSFSPGS